MKDGSLKQYMGMNKGLMLEAKEMNIMREFSIEIVGICGAIREYTGEPYITNIIEKLLIAVEEKDKDKDKENILYLLEKVRTWYANNQPKIQSNSYVFNKSEHIEYEKIIAKYIVELGRYDDSMISDTDITDMSMNIFISHSSKDKLYCDSFVELLEAIGVPESNILYSSSPRHGIPGDNDIFEYLKKHITNRITVFYMLSDNYYNSIYCLNEMGAAWVAQNDFSIFLLPNFTRGIEGVIDKKKKGYTLCNSIELIHFRNRMQEKYKTATLSEEKWEDVKNKFLKSVT